MPQSRKEIRDKFLTKNSDGRQKCENAIIKAGGKVSNGIITLPKQDKLNSVLDEIEYLLDEWDYDFVRD